MFAARMGLDHRCFGRCRTVAMRLELGFSPSFHRWLVGPRLQGQRGVRFPEENGGLFEGKRPPSLYLLLGGVIFFWIRSG